MQCRTVTGVTFGPRSKAAIEEIRKKHHLATMLQVMVPAGAFVNIFLGNDALKAAYNIQSTDFEMMARAMAAVPAIERAVIVRIAQLAALDTVGQESTFWMEFARGILHGCAAATH